MAIENESLAVSKSNGSSDKYLPSDHVSSDDTVSFSAESEHLQLHGDSFSMASKNRTNESFSAHIHVERRRSASDRTKERCSRNSEKLRHDKFKSKLIDKFARPNDDFLCNICKKELIDFLKYVKEHTQTSKSDVLVTVTFLSGGGGGGAALTLLLREHRFDMLPGYAHW